MFGLAQACCFAEAQFRREMNQDAMATETLEERVVLALIRSSWKRRSQEHCKAGNQSPAA